MSDKGEKGLKLKSQLILWFVSVVMVVVGYFWKQHSDQLIGRSAVDDLGMVMLVVGIVLLCISSLTVFVLVSARLNWWLRQSASVWVYGVTVVLFGVPQVLFAIGYFIIQIGTSLPFSLLMLRSTWFETKAHLVMAFAWPGRKKHAALKEGADTKSDVLPCTQKCHEVHDYMAYMDQLAKKTDSTNG